MPSPTRHPHSLRKQTQFPESMQYSLVNREGYVPEILANSKCHRYCRPNIYAQCLQMLLKRREVLHLMTLS